MRLLHVVASGQRRGAEIFTSDLIGQLGRLGVSQAVAMLRRTPEHAVRYDAPVTVLGRADARASHLNVRSVRELRRMIRRYRPDLVLAHGGEPLKYAAAGSVGMGTRLVYRRIGSAHPLIAKGLRRWVYAALVRRADLVITVADAIRRETIDVFGIASRRVVAVPNGADPRRAAPRSGRSATRAGLGIGSSVPVILSAGAFTWEKDPMGQVDLAARVLEEEREAVYLMAGEGPLLGDVEADIRRRSLGDRVRLLGGRDDVPDLLCASDVLVIASRTEGMPGIALEAGMSGVPVAAYSIGGIPEVVVDGTTGLLAPPGDLDALASCVLKLLRNDELRASMGEASRAHCRSRFDIGSVARAYTELFEGLVTASASGG